MSVQVDVHQELELVAKLQDVDDRLRELEQEKGDLPGIVGNLEKEIRERKDEMEQIREKIAEISRNKRSIESQTQLARMKQEKYKEQLYQVTTNREYDAITQQIESNRNEIESNEAAIFTLMEEDEYLVNKNESLSRRLTELNTELEERGQELEEKEEETGQEEAELLHEREKIVVRMKKPVYAHYERIRQVRGVGAARLYAQACGACFAVVPPQRQTEIRRMNDVILCESCGVILLPEIE